MSNLSKYCFLLVLVVLFFALDLISGSVYISFSEILGSLKGNGGINETIVLGFRLPKAIAALSAGVALSVAGMLMQTFFRNPLAGPYVLGVNSLASLSVALFMLAGGGSVSLFFKMGVPFAASVGAFGGLFILLILSGK
ncbi:MAG: iron chelate uptake ABC transporter family permease subunit, partial [Bacteroidia bacterium]